MDSAGKKQFIIVIKRLLEELIVAVGEYLTDLHVELFGSQPQF
jgi:hypothetical protein